MPHPPHDDEHERRVNEALADYMERLDRGEAVDREGFLAQHPDLAADLRAYFDGSDEVECVGGDAPS